MNIMNLLYKLKNISNITKFKKLNTSGKIKVILAVGILLFSGYQYFTQNNLIEETKNFISEKTEHNNTQENTTDKNLYPVLYTFDGDTYFVNINGKKEKIRVLGIDTPEKKGGFRPEGCFGDHASDYAKEKLSHKKVSLLKPKGYNNTDKYGRLLRYVFLDGEDFGAHLISEGYAFSYKKFNHPRRNYYNRLEKEAQKNKKGMWNPENCDYWGGLHY